MIMSHQQELEEKMDKIPIFAENDSGNLHLYKRSNAYVNT